ncbi:MAG: hypothetical protein KF878_30450 [Planctomycetes bacterium]|nr:hypothetical protein [Planctomycetota bacterium]
MRCPACGHDAEPDVPGLRLVAEAARAASGDGRLACLGDRVLLTSDGLVAALGLERGEVLWALDRGPGLGVAGRRVFVSLRAAADAVEVVTAAGLLVRVDPLDGRLLPPPRGWEADALVLGPAVLAREAAGEVVLPLPTGPLRLDGAARPVGPGAVTGGRVLVAPVASGVVAVDLVAGDVLGRVEWPLGGAAAGRRRLLAGPDGVLLAWGPDGLVALGPGSPAALDAAASAVDSAVEDDLDRLAAALDALDWRRRLAAWQALADRAEAAPALRRLLEGGASSEAREAASELLERLARRARWALIAPGASPEQVAALADEPTAAAVLALRPLLGQGPGVADALVGLLPATTDVALRAALIDLALRADERLTGQLVAIIHNARATPDLAFAAADYLVELATDGLERPARRALLNPDELTRTMVQAAALRRGDPALLERLRPDPAYWRALEGSPMHQAILGQVGEPDRQTLMDELTRALAPVPGAGD